MNQVPRVAYDVSVLGISHFNPRSRTGIFRVINETAKHLLQREDLHLTLTACKAYWEMAATHYYLQESFSDTYCYSSPVQPKSYSSLILEVQRRLVEANWDKVSSKLNHKLIRRLISLPIEKLLPPRLNFQRSTFSTFRSMEL
jgi:hypothetical protein